MSADNYWDYHECRWVASLTQSMGSGTVGASTSFSPAYPGPSGSVSSRRRLTAAHGKEMAMFVQVFQGHVHDGAAMKRALDRWNAQLAPEAEGWLGSTSGVTDDGTFFGCARFTSAQAARRNSDRAEQGEWWSSTSKCFSGEVDFHDCSEVVVVRGGGSDEAGFVRVIQGRAHDVARLREVSTEFETRFPSLRPDLLGFTVALHDDGDGAFTQVAYFTTEEAAREGERQEPPEDARQLLQEEMSLWQDVTYLDLRQPWLHSPARSGGG